MKIMESVKEMNIFKMGYEIHYFKEENISIDMFKTSIYITDLKDAYKRGKEVKRIKLISSEGKAVKGFYELIEQYGGVKSLVKALFDGEKIENDNLEVKEVSLRAIRVYTPFLKIKEIKEPKKWKISDVAKAIMSGQIQVGVINGIYTDDYYNDSKRNFGKGELDLNKFCKELIEEPSGWRCYPISKGEGKIKLAVNCYNFNLNTLYFNNPTE